jgi:uncharacterized membrane protein
MMCLFLEPFPYPTLFQAPQYYSVFPQVVVLYSNQSLFCFLHNPLIILCIYIKLNSISTFLGMTNDKRWHLFSGAIGLFLLQHVIQGWCPPLSLIRKIGFRTTSEINKERNELIKALELKRNNSVY